MLPYEDHPAYGWSIKVLLLLPLFVLLIEFVILSPGGDAQDLVFIPATVVFFLGVFWGVLPHRYAVLDDRLRIDLGWPFGLNVYFKNIVWVRRDPGRWRASVNLVTTLSQASTLCIVPRRGMPIVITPGQRNVFADHLEKALDVWRRRQGG